jgi:hypothetical protein
MFTKIFSRKTVEYGCNVNNMQQALDSLRYYNAHDQILQLHLDRLQTDLDAKR